MDCEATSTKIGHKFSLITELSTEKYILYCKTIIRGRNVLVQSNRGRNILVQTVRERNVQVQKSLGETSRSKKSGAKHPGPKSQGAKRPGLKYQGRNVLVQKGRSDTSWTKNVRGQNDLVQNFRG